MSQMNYNTPPTRGKTHGYSRRQFITTALAGASALMTDPKWASGAVKEKSRNKGLTSDLVTLGNTGIETSRLAQGTGSKGGGRTSFQSSLGVKAFKKLIRHGLDQGIRFIDTSDAYGVHTYLKRALKGVPRDNYTLLTKIWPYKDFWNSPSGGAKDEVNRFRKELDSDVIDICMIHYMKNKAWPQTYERIRDELSEMKQKGVVKAVGASCHDLGALKVAAKHPWVDVIFARINNVGKKATMGVSVEEVAPVLKQARANGKVIVGMKIFGAGKLVSPEQKDASLKFVFDNDLVDAITVGMMNPEQVSDTIQRMNYVLKG